VSFIQPIRGDAHGATLANAQTTLLFLPGTQSALPGAARLRKRAPIHTARQLPPAKCATAPKIN
jgi:hypothetical protein